MLSQNHASDLFAFFHGCQDEGVLVWSLATSLSLPAAKSSTNMFLGSYRGTRDTEYCSCFSSMLKSLQGCVKTFYDFSCITVLNLILYCLALSSGEIIYHVVKHHILNFYQNMKFIQTHSLKCTNLMVLPISSRSGRTCNMRRKDLQRVL